GRDSASALLRREGSVGGFVHQRVELAGIGDADAEEPAFPHRISVDQLWPVVQRTVHLDHLARDRRIDLARRLHRFDDRRFRAGGEALANLRQLDEDHVAELLLSESADANGGDAAIDAYPLMLLAVSEVAHRILLMA